MVQQTNPPGQDPATTPVTPPATTPPAQGAAAQTAGQQQMGQAQPPAGQQPPAAYPPAGYPPYPYPPMDQYGAPPGAYPPAGYPPQRGAYPPAGYPPQGGAYPPAAYPPQQGGAYPPGAYPPPAVEDTTPANFQLGTKIPAKLKVTSPKHSLKFDEEYFIKLLAGSISLSKDEKKKIIESIPKLKQAQIDELIKIFEEEKQKFAALSKKHVPQLEKLAQQHYDEWMQLEDEWVLAEKKQEDTSKAEDIRKQLGI